MKFFKKTIVKLMVVLCLSLSITPVMSPNTPIVTTVQAASYSKSTVKAVQQKLNNAGYNCGTADGVSGSKTKVAIKSYQKAHDLNVTGTINKALLKSMGIKANYATKTNTTSSAKPKAATVYVTKTGSKYHRSGCRYLSRSKISISLDQAKQNYGPCSVCNP